jgi:hypothetical protein
MCLVCKYIEKPSEVTFPLKIPQAILIGRYDHRRRHKGDRGVTFQPKEGVSKEELEIILSIFDDPRF